MTPPSPGWALLLFLAFPSGAFSQKALADSAVLSSQNVPVSMRDGIVLRADVVRPKNGGPFPVLVYRTPYGKEDALKEYTTFQHAVERGYAVVVQDVRGRYVSDGEFRPYENEGRDGYDTIEWAAHQPWSNGQVGTFGLSYPGAVQWLAAVENPPHLRAMVPAMTFSTPQNFFYAGGVWDLSWMEWIWDNIAPDARVKKKLPGPATYDAAVATWDQVGTTMQTRLPLRDLTELKDVAPYYFDWLSHPADDSWWDWCELRNKYNRVHVAVLNLSGWYDDNYGPEGATTNFAGLVKARGSSRPQTSLLLGPWVHGVEGIAKARSGEREFGPKAKVDYDAVVLDWMDHYLRGVDNGVEHRKPVHYFVMGDNEWHDSDAWPPTADRTTYFLGGMLAGGHGGHLNTNAPTGHKQFAAFVSDPANPVRNRYPNSGAHDYQELSKRSDVLTFDSAVLDRDMEVTGPIQARIYFSCDCRDTDLWVRLLDVGPDGSAFNLMSPGLDVQRASYLDLAHGRHLLIPDQIYELALDHLITSNVFQKGHAIRIQISASFFPNFSRNLHTGELESMSSAMKKTNIRIYHDVEHPSHIELPIVWR